VCVCVRVCVSARVRACVCVCVYVCACACHPPSSLHSSVHCCLSVSLSPCAGVSRIAVSWSHRNQCRIGANSNVSRSPRDRVSGTWIYHRLCRQSWLRIVCLAMRFSMRMTYHRSCRQSRPRTLCLAMRFSMRMTCYRSCRQSRPRTLCLAMRFSMRMTYHRSCRQTATIDWSDHLSNHAFEIVNV
jgi:hypothetical protein